MVESITQQMNNYRRDLFCRSCRFHVWIRYGDFDFPPKESL